MPPGRGSRDSEWSGGCSQLGLSCLSRFRGALRWVGRAKMSAILSLPHPAGASGAESRFSSISNQSGENTTAAATNAAKTKTRLTGGSGPRSCNSQLAYSYCLQLAYCCLLHSSVHLLPTAFISTATAWCIHQYNSCLAWCIHQYVYCQLHSSVHLLLTAYSSCMVHSSRHLPQLHSSLHLRQLHSSTRSKLRGKVRLGVSVRDIRHPGL